MQTTPRCSTAHGSHSTAITSGNRLYNDALKQPYGTSAHFIDSASL
jgi:hypothetical protein